jgi:hypothetical protein
MVEAERNFSKKKTYFDSGSAIRSAIRGLNQHAFGYQ